MPSPRRSPQSPRSASSRAASSRAASSRVAVAFDRLVGRCFYRVHRVVYRLSRGAIGHRSPAGPILLLTTVGRRRGRHRTTPLLYLADHLSEGDRYLVVASNGGRDEPPAWLRNLEATPHAEVQIGPRRHRVHAEVLRGPSADVLWPRLVAHHRGWRDYQALTEREIPVVRLEPLGVPPSTGARPTARPRRAPSGGKPPPHLPGRSSR